MDRIGFRGSKGFSLTELVIVMALAAVAASFAIPLLSGSMRGMQLLSDARKIASTMSYAKLSSTAQMTNYRLAFDVANRQWSLLKRNAGGEFELQQAVNGLSDGVHNSGIAFKSTSDSAPSGFPASSSSEITFNTRGLPGDLGIIYLSNEDMDYAVSVSLAGKVQVWKYENSQWSPV